MGVQLRLPGLPRRLDERQQPTAGDVRRRPDRRRAVHDGLTGCGDFDYGTGDGGGQPDNTAPTAKATATPTQAKAGQQVQLDGSGSTDAETPNDLDYCWDFGDGGSTKDSSDVSPTASWKRGGEKTVTLTVTDPEGETATDTVTVTVSGRVKHVNAQSRKVTKHGSWRTRHGGGAADGNYMDNLGSGQGKDRMVFTFTSRRLDLIYGTARRGGVAKVWIDGFRQPTLSFHAHRKAVKINRTARYRHLGPGQHTVKVVVTKSRRLRGGLQPHQLSHHP